MIKNLILLTALGLSFSSNLFAQQGSIEGIKTSEFQGVHEITNEGFYTVYEEAKQKGKVRNYTVKFLDFNYKVTKQTQVELSKNAVVSSSANNETHIAIAFSDIKDKKVKLRSLTLRGELQGEVDLTKSVGPKADIYKAPEGFVVVNYVLPSLVSTKIQFEIIYFDNELKQIWKKELKDDLVRAVYDVVATEDGFAILYCTGKGLNKENYDQHLIRVNNEGKEIFDKVFASNYYYYPNKIILEGENTLIFGSFPEEGKSKPIGIFGIAMDASGKIVAKNEVDYKTNISPTIKDIKDSEDINMKEEPQFIVNDVLKTETGYIVITETIRLRPAPGGAVEVGTGGSGATITVNTAFIMGDFLILSLDKELQMNKIQVVNKKKNKVVFQGIITNVNMYYPILRQNNVSNYRFSQIDDKGEIAMVYTIRSSYMSNIKVGIADLNSKETILKSVYIESDLEKLKDVNAFGVLKNTENKISVYIFRKSLLNFYDLKY